MSLGYAAIVHFVLRDKRSALHMYSCEDGEIYVGPEPSVLACKVVHAKRHPDGVPVWVPENVDVPYMLEDCILEIRNCPNAKHITPRGIDAQVLRLFG